MKKSICLVTIVLVAMLLLSSCAVNTTEIGGDNTDNSVSDSLAANGTEDITAEKALTPESSALDTLNNIDNGDTYEPAIGGEHMCQIHHYCYHDIPGALSDLVGAEKFDEWWDSLPEPNYDDPEKCTSEFTIKAFVDYFDITKEDFENLCDSLSYCEIDTDVLFSGTDDEVEQYFRNIDELEKYGYKRTHYNYILNGIRDDYAEELSKIETTYAYTCIPELVVMFDIERSKLENYIKEATEQYQNKIGKSYTFDYNLDMIYGSEGEIVLELESDISNRQLRNLLNEMFCRIGRYAE